MWGIVDLVTTFTKNSFSNFLASNPNIQNALNIIVITWDDNRIVIDETKLTAPQLAAFTNFVNKLGYN